MKTHPPYLKVLRAYRSTITAILPDELGILSVYTNVTKILHLVDIDEPEIVINQVLYKRDSTYDIVTGRD
jgi:hypothetical protein